jgi:tetratricopeptide (TPR) repeat protein
MVFPSISRCDSNMKTLLLGSLGIVLSSVFCCSAGAQTQEQIDEAARLLGRPQTKTSALSFWAGVAEGEGKYEEANKFYVQMQALYELDFGPLNGRVAWMLAKQALCFSKLGDRQKAAGLVSRAQEMIASRFAASEGGERKYFESARQILTSPDLAVAEATLIIQAEGNEAPKVPDYRSDAQCALEAGRAGKTEQAIEHYRKSLSGCPEDAGERGVLLIALGEAELERQDFAAARKAFMQVVDLFGKPTNRLSPLDVAGAHRGLAELALLEKNLSEAEKQLETAQSIYSKLEPEDGKSRVLWLMEQIGLRTVRIKFFNAKGAKEKEKAEVADLAADYAEHEKLMRLLNDVPPVRPITSLDQKQVAAGIDAAQTNPVEVLSGGLRTFQFGKHRFVLDTLKGDRLQVNEREKFISVNIMGPERLGKGARVFNVSIISAPQMDTASMKSELLAGMLLPYRQRLSDFKEEKISVTLAAGRVESGVEYSGSYAGTVSARGFFVLVPLAGTVYVLQGSDRAEFYRESLALIKELMKSLKIES